MHRIINQAFYKGDSGGGTGGTSRQNRANTPSGVNYEQFMAMSEDAKYKFISEVINNLNITVPEHVDESDLSKFMYAIGLNNKPQIVADSELDKIEGKDLYRTVYNPQTPPPYSTDILDQIRYGDYTRIGGSGSLFHGRAIYFATDYKTSAYYGYGEAKPVMMRAKISKNANIISEYDLMDIVFNDKTIRNITKSEDAYGLYALAHGIDGWRAHQPPDGEFVMIVNRGALVASSATKSIKKKDVQKGAWHK